MLFLLGFVTGSVVGQELPGVCGNSTEDQLQYESRLLNNLAKADAGGVFQRGAIQYVPVHFHLVGDAQGNGKVKEVRVLDQLCALNSAFESTEFRFYLAPHPTKGLFNYTINATNVYNNQDAWFTMNSNRHPNAINIYIVEDAVSGNNNPGLTLAYYNIPRDWIVSRKDRINGSKTNSTLPHEVGHFFSLMHTFLGYESNPFDSADPTWPKAPVTSPGGQATERVNGTNCSTAADRICDTPPDYNFGLGNGSCTYTGGAQDPLGTPVDPMENNMMGYFETCSNYVFTPQQNAAMQADLASSARNYLDNNFTPVSTEINTPANLLVAPASGANVPFYNEVLVEWQSLPEAKYYLLEFDIISTYVSPLSQSFIVDTNSKLVTTLEPNRNYYWRVRPFNEYVTCATPRQRTFRTSTVSAVHTIPDLTAWQVAPNPVKSGQPINLFLQTAKGFEASVRVFDATGRQVFEQNSIPVSAGDQQIELTTGALNSGFYTVLLQTQEGQVARKVSVVQ
ncbi:MAG: zinc-dependent metalloprotease [Saprospiraceae bacterium]|nr:zinc-dependent metalloprotease [Saprospiraceae bacterium]